MRMPHRIQRWIGLPILLLLVTSAWYVTAICWETPIWQHPDDYPAHSLGHAMNLEESLETGKRFQNPGLGAHPGIPFFISSWIAFKGAQWSQTGLNKTDSNGDISWRTLQHPERFWFFNKLVALILALLGTAAIWLFASAYGAGTAFICGLIYYSLSSVSWTHSFSYLTNDSFALLLAGGFGLIARPALRRNRGGAFYWWVLWGFWCGCGYLVKLNYLALFFGALTGLGVAWSTGRFGFLEAVKKGGLLFLGIASAMVCGIAIIGWASFINLLQTHFLFAAHTKLYGSGDMGILSFHEMWSAFVRAAADPFLVLAIALVVIVCIGVISRGWKDTDTAESESPLLAAMAAIIILSFLAALKHYAPHYTLITSASIAVAAAMLVGRSKRKLWRGGVLAFCVVALLTSTFWRAKDQFETRHQAAIAALADRDQILSLPINPGEYRLWTYRAPMPEFRMGFAVIYSGVDRLITKLREAEAKGFDRSSYINRTPQFPWRYIILEKLHYNSLQAVRKLDFYQPTDRLIELETVIVIDRTNGDRLQPWPGL